MPSSRRLTAVPPNEERSPRANRGSAVGSIHRHAAGPRELRAGLVPAGAAALALALGLIGAGNASASPAPGAFAVRPAEFSAADPTTRDYFKLKLSPGQAEARSVIVTNSGRVPVRLLVYPVDGLTGITSGVVYANRGAPLRATGRWVDAHVGRLTVGPHRKATIPFSVRVPASAAPGDHLAGLAFQNADPRTSTSRFRIVQVIREVVGVLVRVPGRGHAELQLGAPRLAEPPAGSAGSLVVPIGNAGGRLCKPRLRLYVDRPGRTVVCDRQDARHHPPRGPDRLSAPARPSPRARPLHRADAGHVHRRRGDPNRGDRRRPNRITWRVMPVRGPTAEREPAADGAVRRGDRGDARARDRPPDPATSGPRRLAAPSPRSDPRRDDHAAARRCRRRGADCSRRSAALPAGRLVSTRPRTAAASPSRSV